MTKAKITKVAVESLNEFETIDFRKINRDIRNFFRFSNEKTILVREIIKIIRPQKSYSVLDIGCGEGYFIREIHKKVKKCVALDPDPEMLAILKEKIGDSSNVFLVPKRFEDYENNEKFDITLTSHTLSFFKNKWNAIMKMLNYTKKGGKAIIVLHSNFSEQFQILEEMFRKAYEKRINHIYAEALYNHLVACGLEPKLNKVETVSKLPSLDTVCEMSYFLFRIDFQKARSDIKNLIREYLEKRTKNEYIVIKTIHGIITLQKSSDARRIEPNL